VLKQPERHNALFSAMSSSSLRREEISAEAQETKETPVYVAVPDCGLPAEDDDEGLREEAEL